MRITPTKDQTGRRRSKDQLTLPFCEFVTDVIGSPMGRRMKPPT